MEILYETSTGKVLHHADNLTLKWMNGRNDLDVLKALIASGKVTILTAVLSDTKKKWLDDQEAVVVGGVIRRDPKIRNSTRMREAAKDIASLWPENDRLTMERALLDERLQTRIRGIV